MFPKVDNIWCLRIKDSDCPELRVGRFVKVKFHSVTYCIKGHKLDLQFSLIYVRALAAKPLPENYNSKTCL